MKRKVYVLIPAKGQSKRLKNKNILKINNKTLIEIAIDCVKSNKKVDEIFVSTNSMKIQYLAKNLGVTSYLRQAKYNNNNLPAKSVVIDFINQFKLTKNSIIIYLQPTSPLRNSLHVKKALDKYLKTERKKILISFIKKSKIVLKGFYFKNKTITPIFKNNFSNSNIQDLPDVIIPNGAIYIFTIREFLKKKNFPTKGILPYFMSKEVSLDIDVKEDYEKAKKILKNEK